MSEPDFDVSFFADAGILVNRYRELLVEIEQHQRSLWKEIRGEKSKDGKMIPIFTEKASEPLEALRVAEEKLNKLKKDAETFSQLVKPYRSFREFQLAHDQQARAVANAQHDLKNYTTQAAKRGVPAESLSDDPKVREAALRLDRIKAQSKAGELGERLKKAKSILDKYQ